MTTKERQHRSLRAMTDTADAREETFRGREYIVVPVIAMVEGVRFGAAQDEPELGLARVFAKYPASWDSRPIVVNHPKIKGQHVSAGSPEVREDYEIGFTANSKRDGTRLKMEAWLDKELLDTVDGGDIFVQKIADGEMIEVSVGFFTDVILKRGEFKGQSYGGVWENVFSDHLAFLTSEKGACSIEDGCGALRNNQSKETDMTLRTDSSADCGCEGSSDKKKSCTCSTNPSAQSEESPKNSSTAGTAPKAEHQSSGEMSVQAEPTNVEEFVVHSISDGVTSNSVWQILATALDEFIGGRVWLMTFTAGENSTAVYEYWDGDNYIIKGIRFNMDADGKVTFEGEPFKVRVVSHLYTEQESNMTTQSEQAENKVEGAQGAEQPTVQQEAPKPEGPKVLSQADALAAMDPSARAEIEAALKLQSDRKEEAITALKESGRCKFDDDYLRAQSLGTLENLIELAAVPDYSGRAAPAPTNAPAPTVQSEQNSMYMAAPADIFADPK